MKRPKPFFVMLLCCSLLLAGFSAPLRSQTPQPVPTATQAGEIPIPFVTLASNPTSELKENGEWDPGAHAPPLSWTTQSQLDVAGPRAFLVTTPAEASAVAQWLSPNAQAQLATRTDSDYTQTVVLLVMLGMTSSCCSNRFIQRIAATDEGTINVYTLTQSANMGTADVITAYELVEIQRSALPDWFSPQTPLSVWRSTQDLGYLVVALHA